MNPEPIDLQTNTLTARPLNNPLGIEMSIRAIAVCSFYKGVKKLVTVSDLPTYICPSRNLFLLVKTYFSRPTEMKLMLSEEKKKGRGAGTQYMGYLLVQCTLLPKSQDDMDQVGPFTVSSQR